MKQLTSVDMYFNNVEQWHNEMILLREVLLSTTLDETIKWGMPYYTCGGKNVVALVGFKHYFGLWFHQGALLKDERNLLINAQEGKTKALRQWRMSSINEIRKKIIKDYVKESVEFLIAGKEIGPEKKGSPVVPVIMQNEFDATKETSAQFDRMSPGKQREYIDYINSAKRETTKISRLAKILPLIAAGRGLNDRYR